MLTSTTLVDIRHLFGERIAKGSQVIPEAEFPPTLKIREYLENDFPIFQSRKNSGDLGENTKYQGICDSDPEGKGFHQFGVCAYCAMCPSCVH